MKAFVLSGGSMILETTDHLVKYLEEDGFDVYATEESEELSGPKLTECDLLVLNSCLWTGSGHGISHEARLALTRHIELGRATVIMHSSIANWDDWPQFIDLVGGIWQWGHSNHTPPDSGFTIVKTEDHPLMDHLPDSFEVIDEMYYDLVFTPGVHVVARTSGQHGSHPMVWFRQSDHLRVPTIAIGHDERSVTHPAYVQLFRNACKWTLGGGQQ